jgi:hypothetical protein
MYHLEVKDLVLLNPLQAIKLFIIILMAVVETNTLFREVVE